MKIRYTDETGSLSYFPRRQKKSGRIKQMPENNTYVWELHQSQHNNASPACPDS